MCRLLGIVSAVPVDFGKLLAERPRSLAALGAEHRDGWGLASFHAGRWSVHKGTRPAAEDDRFTRRASGLRGEVLVSHVRKRTVGATRRANTHPFVRGRWVFAHNGTIEDGAHLRANASRARLDDIAGDTDSELFFAWLLTRLDEANLADRPASRETDAVVGAAVRGCRARAGFGSFNFLLSEGTTCYVHRFGRGLWLLERGGGGRRAAAAFVASEPTTGERWRELGDGTLLRVDRTATVTAL
jgi:glutamine amidotransferase